MLTSGLATIYFLTDVSRSGPSSAMLSSVLVEGSQLQAAKMYWDPLHGPAIAIGSFRDRVIVSGRARSRSGCVRL